MRTLRGGALTASLLATLCAPSLAAAIDPIWTSSFSHALTGVNGHVHGVALSPAGDFVYAAGDREGRIWLGKFTALGELVWERSLSTGYALGVGVGPLGQVGVIGPVLFSTTPVVVSSHVIAVLDGNGNVLPGFPQLATGYYDLYAVSTTPYRAAIAFDADNSVFAGWNESTTTVRVRKIAQSGAPLGEFRLTAHPGLLFEDLAVDTRTTGGFYVVTEGSQITLSLYNKATLALVRSVTRPWVGHGCCRRQSVSFGPNGVIVGGQFLDVLEPLVAKTWVARYSPDLLMKGFEYIGERSQGGNRIHGIAQRRPSCGAMYAVGSSTPNLVSNSTAAWMGLFGQDGQFWNYRTDAQAYHGDAITADLNKTFYVGGTTKRGRIYLARFDENSCGSPVLPPPAPCVTWPSAFPNPFKLGREKVVIQYDLLQGVVSRPKTVTLKITGPGGEPVFTEPNMPGLRFNAYRWDGKNSQAQLVASGTYEAVLEIALEDGPTCRSHMRIGAR